MPGRQRGEQRLARARRPAHQQIVPARRGDLQRALGDFLPLDLREVRPPTGGLGFGRWRRRHAARYPSDAPAARADRARRSPRARPPKRASLPCAAGQIRPMSSAEAWSAASSTPGDGAIRPSRREFADRDIVRQRFRIGRPDRRQQAERDRQIVVRAFLGQVGRRQVDRDHAWAAARDRSRPAPHAPARGSRPPLCPASPTMVNFGKARRELHLHLDGAGLEAEISDRGDGRDHLIPSCRAGWHPGHGD